MHGLGLAVGDGHLSALLERDLLAVWSGLTLAAGAVLHLAPERVGHPHICHLLWFMIPHLLTISAVDLRNNELDSLGNQFTFLPRDRFTSFITRPHLLALIKNIFSFFQKYFISFSPSGSVSHNVTQFCLVTLRHSGNIFTWGIIFLPCNTIINNEMEL